MFNINVSSMRNKKNCVFRILPFLPGAGETLYTEK